MGITRFAIKTGIVGGFIYYTVREGVWGDQEDAVKVYTRIYDNVAPYVKKNLPEEVVQEVDKIPSSGDLKNFMVRYYNMGVIASMGFIADLPTHTSNGITSLSKTVQSMMNEEK